MDRFMHKVQGSYEYQDSNFEVLLGSINGGSVIIRRRAEASPLIERGYTSMALNMLRPVVHWQF